MSNKKQTALSMNDDKICVFTILWNVRSCYKCWLCQITLHSVLISSINEGNESIILLHVRCQQKQVHSLLLPEKLIRWISKWINANDYSNIKVIKANENILPNIQTRSTHFVNGFMFKVLDYVLEKNSMQSIVTTYNR